jgi:hypothetical protein
MSKKQDFRIEEISPVRPGHPGGHRKISHQTFPNQTFAFLSLPP